MRVPGNNGERDRKKCASNARENGRMVRVPGIMDMRAWMGSSNAWKSCRIDECSRNYECLCLDTIMGVM